MPGSKPLDLNKPIDYASLKGRNILITGGASGFGKAFVQVFAKHGANIVVADIQEGPGKQLEEDLSSQGVKILFIQTDVTSWSSTVHLLRKAVAFLPRHEIDVFIPNAGVLSKFPTEIWPQHPDRLSDLDPMGPDPDFTGGTLEVNLKAVYVATLLVLRYAMGLHKPEGVKGQGKAVILIGSLAGYCGAEKSVEYTASKFGVRGILRGFRRLLAGTGVRINAVSPFYVETPLTAHATPTLKEAGIPLAPVEHVLEATVRLATDEDAHGRSIFVMPEGLSDGGDDAAGLQGGKAFSVEGLGPQWELLITGPLSDENFPSNTDDGGRRMVDVDLGGV